MKTSDLTEIISYFCSDKMRQMDEDVYQNVARPGDYACAYRKQDGTANAALHLFVVIHVYHKVT